MFNTNFGVYKLIFAVELIIAEALFVYRFKRKNKFLLKLIPSLIVYILIAFFFPVPFYNPYYGSFVFIVLFIISLLIIKFCFDESTYSVMFSGLAGYTVQHLAYESKNLLVLICGFEGMKNDIYSDGQYIFASVNEIIIYLATYICIYLLFYLIFGKRIKQNNNTDLRSGTLLSLASLIIIIDVVLNMIVVYRSYNSPDVTYQIVSSLYNIICCTLALLIQFGVLTRQQLERKVDIIYQLWQHDLKQYNFSKESIDLINQKCHDIKHQIRKYKGTESLTEDAILELEEAISIYDSHIKTGNNALDIILSEKILFCKKNNIDITCMADGSKLDFMSDTSIYSLFGNILDNAIEAVLKLEEDKRIIGVVVKKEEELLTIHVYNYYGEELIIEDNHLITSKHDKTNHGFGLDSIRMITESYGGNFSIKYDNNIFNINILFPLKDREGINLKNALVPEVVRNQEIISSKKSLSEIIKMILPFLIIIFIAIIAIVIVINLEIYTIIKK